MAKPIQYCKVKRKEKKISLSLQSTDSQKQGTILEALAYSVPPLPFSSSIIYVCIYISPDCNHISLFFLHSCPVYNDFNNLLNDHTSSLSGSFPPVYYQNINHSDPSKLNSDYAVLCFSFHSG